MMLRVLCAGSLLVLAACSSSGVRVDDLTGSGFAPVNAEGLIDVSPVAGSVSGTSPAASNGDSGYAFAVDTKGNRVSALAALVNPQGIAGRPTTGTGSYKANFKIAEIRNIKTSRDVAEITGSLPIRVDFGNGKVAGNGDGLTVAGQMAAKGTGYVGATTWRGVQGDLKGRVNSDRIIGAFSGSSPTSVYAGGIIGSGRITP